MKNHPCDSCNKDVVVEIEYEPEFCCNGYECGCYGRVTNPVFCDTCEKQIFGEKVDAE